MARMTSVESEQTLYQLNPTSQELDWIKQHTQWLYDSKKAYKLGSPEGMMCCIEAMEDCIARKSHELAAKYVDDGSFSVPPAYACAGPAIGGGATSSVFR